MRREGGEEAKIDSPSLSIHLDLSIPADTLTPPTILFRGNHDKEISR